VRAFGVAIHARVHAAAVELDAQEWTPGRSRAIVGHVADDGTGLPVESPGLRARPVSALLALFGALLAGLVAGRAARAADLRAGPLAGRLLGLLVPPLIGLQGVVIGSDARVVGRLAVVGAQAAALALGTLSVSALVAVLLGRRLGGWPDLGEARSAAHPLRAVLRVAAALALGIALGAAHVLPAGFDAPAWAWRLLLALIAVVGVETGAEGRSLLAQVRGAPSLLLLPLATLVGSLLVGAGAAALLGRAGLAGAAGCGWYSLAGPLVGGVLGPEAGALAFLANLLREAFALLLLPLLVRHAGPGPAIAAAGATAMDTALPFLARAAGSGAVLPALVSGGLVSAAVPWLLGLIVGG
jgi:uncharacterized membrane protein YbjE (DUF340 family)